jgi:hypothetical protein
LSAKGPVTIEFAYENRVSGPTEVHNVIAEIPGREKPDEWIIIGAHLDSWDYGTGAQDNGSGCAMVLEAARAIAMMGAPRRSIRFALWGGEEEGLLGSAAYVKAHKAELGKCVAALNTDNGAGHPKGWKVQGRADLAEAMKSISDPLLTGSGAGGGAPRKLHSTPITATSCLKASRCSICEGTCLITARFTTNRAIRSTRLTLTISRRVRRLLR